MESAPSFVRPPGQISTVEDVEQVRELADWVTDLERTVPIVVLTARNRHREPYYPPAFAQRLVGTAAAVVAIRQRERSALTVELDRCLPEGLMAFNGAARIFWPFAQAGRRPERHPLLLADRDDTAGPDRRAKLAHRWREGPGEERVAPKAASAPKPTVAPGPTSSAGAAPDLAMSEAFEVLIVRAWLQLLPDPADRVRFPLPAYEIATELREQLEVLEPARAPVADAAARVLSGFAWTERGPVPERLLQGDAPVLRDEDRAVRWRYLLPGGEWRLDLWQPAHRPPTLVRIARAATDADHTTAAPSAAQPRPGRPGDPEPVPAASPRARGSFQIHDDDLVRVLRSADGPLRVAELRAALEVPTDVSPAIMRRVLAGALDRGVITRSGDRRGTRYAIAS